MTWASMCQRSPGSQLTSPEGETPLSWLWEVNITNVNDSSLVCPPLPPSMSREPSDSSHCLRVLPASMAGPQVTALSIRA